MKKLLMLGTSKISTEMIKYAKSQGVYTIVADPHEPKDSIAKQISDEHWEIDLADLYCSYSSLLDSDDSNDACIG